MTAGREWALEVCSECSSVLDNAPAAEPGMRFCETCGDDMLVDAVRAHEVVAEKPKAENL